jgi:hypothetical protein
VGCAQLQCCCRQVPSAHEGCCDVAKLAHSERLDAFHTSVDDQPGCHIQTPVCTSAGTELARSYSCNIFETKRAKIKEGRSAKAECKQRQQQLVCIMLHGMQSLPCAGTSTQCTHRRSVSGYLRPATGPRSRWAVSSTRQQQSTKADPVATPVDRQRGIRLASQRLEELLAEATLRQAFFWCWQ